MNRSFALRFAAVLLPVAAGLVIACTAETGPGAPKRTSGCIDIDCTFDAAILPTPTPASDASDQ